MSKVVHEATPGRYVIEAKGFDGSPEWGPFVSRRTLEGAISKCDTLAEYAPENRFRVVDTERS